MSISKEVNEIISCCSVPIISLTPFYTSPPACAQAVSRNATPTLSCPAPSSPLPHDRHRPTRTSPGSWPSDMKRPWRRALLFPSRGWRGACFPPLPFRTQTGMYLGQAGRGWTCQDRRGDGGGDDSIFQVFGVSELGPVQPLTALSRPARADAPASPGPGSGWGESQSFLSEQPPLLALGTMQRPPPHSRRTHIPHSPRHAPLAGGGSLHPRKRAMEQFTAAASSWSSFLSGDKRRGYKPVAA